MITAAATMKGQALKGGPTPPSFCGGNPPLSGVSTAMTHPIKRRPMIFQPQSLQVRKPKKNPPTGPAATTLIKVNTISFEAVIFFAEL